MMMHSWANVNPVVKYRADGDRLSVIIKVEVIKIMGDY